MTQFGSVLFDDGLHELVDEVVVFLASDALVSQPDVERVFEQRLVVGADVERDRETFVGLDARTCRVQTQLSCNAR